MSSKFILHVIAGVLVVCGGCGKPEQAITPSATPPAPKEAASQLQRAFTASDAETKGSATAASEAIRSGDYEKAVVTLQAIKQRKDLSFDQGVAVYNSELSLEKTLLAGMSAGDPKAKQANEVLKKSRRN
jgi:hypothetical protein